MNYLVTMLTKQNCTKLELHEDFKKIVKDSNKYKNFTDTHTKKKLLPIFYL